MFHWAEYSNHFHLNSALALA